MMAQNATVVFLESFINAIQIICSDLTYLIYVIFNLTFGLFLTFTQEFFTSTNNFDIFRKQMILEGVECVREFRP